MTDSYFPIKVKYDGDEQAVIVKSPKEIRSGVSFKVLRTNVKDDGK